MTSIPASAPPRKRTPKGTKRILATQAHLFDTEAGTEDLVRCARCATYRPASAFSPDARGYCRPCKQSYEHSKYDRRYRRHHSLLKNYGITHTQYDTMLAAQQGVCAACGLAETTLDPRTQEVKYLCVDHDHATGRVRGLLCGGCNAALGQLGEDPQRARALAAYIEQNCSTNATMD